jgi:hypothetical protein
MTLMQSAKSAAHLLRLLMEIETPMQNAHISRQIEVM